MKRKGKIDWKVKLVFSILCGTILVIGLLFGITYGYFVRKLTLNNEKIVHMTFEEAEKDLKVMMGNAEDQLNRFSNNALAWEFSANNFSSTVQQSIVIKKIIQNFDEMISANTDVYGFAILNGDGRTAVSTAEKKSRTGETKISDSMQSFLRECKKNYPYVNWRAGNEIEISDESQLCTLTNRPVLLGVKALGEADGSWEDSYLLVALDEEDVQKSYGQAVYNGSEAVLVNGERKIISATGKEFLGTVYEPEEENQNIIHDISYNGWTLINMIPKKNYLREAKDIRNFGIILGILASLGMIVVAIGWSRKYTGPIQSLMEQMESVGKEQLDIVKPKKAGLPELDNLNEEFYSTVQKLKGYIRRLQDVEQEKAKEELLALQYQINPHFLYNSLNSIRWMALMTNNTKIADSLVTLSKVIMPILRNPAFTWKLKDEIEFLKNYTEMMQIRYGNYMEYHVDCKPCLQEEIFPRFILQPVIENCFVHGGSTTEVREIFIRIRKTENENFFIEVQNTGVRLDGCKIAEINQAMQKPGKDGSHIGLSNIYKRLKLLYGEKGNVWMESDSGGVFVYIAF